MDKDKSAYEVAQYWASMGVPVFPVRANKTPLTAHGYKDATTDPKTIKKWFDNRSRLQIGIPTNPPIVVVDLDGESAEQAWLEHNQGEFGTKYVLQTPHGKHLYFTGTDIRRSIRVLQTSSSEGIDILGKGGYTIVYGTGRNWSTMPETIQDLPTIPNWIKELVEERIRPYTPLPTGYTAPEVKASDTGTPWGKAVLRRALEEIANGSSGQRHSILMRKALAVGGTLASGHLIIPQDTLVAYLAEASIASGHDPTDAWRTANDMVQAGLTRPRVPRERAGKKMETTKEKIMTQDTQDTSVKWRKLEKGWAIEAPSGKFGPGDTITLPNKHGEQVQVVVHSVSKEWKTDQGDSRVFCYLERGTKSPNASPEATAKLAKGKAEAAREAVAKNPSTPVKDLTKLANGKSKEREKDRTIPHFEKLAKTNQWVVVAEEGTITKGDVIDVIKADGSVDAVTIRGVGKPFDDPKTGKKLLVAFPERETRTSPSEDVTIQQTATLER